MIDDVRSSDAFTEITDSGGHYHEEGRAVALELLKAGSISKGVYFGLTGTREIGLELLGGNIFAVN